MSSFSLDVLVLGAFLALVIMAAYVVYADHLHMVLLALYRVLGLLSMVGVGICAWCLVLGFLQIDPRINQSVLFGCMFAVWAPLVVATAVTSPEGATRPRVGRGVNADHVFAAVPRWMRLTSIALFVPAYFGSLWGVLMFFYGSAAIGFDGLARLENEKR